jgi:pimeloyl-ACP methyl ester carboxylesterase
MEDSDVNQAPPRSASVSSPPTAKRDAAPGRSAWRIGAVCALLAGAAIANHLIAKRNERRHPPSGRFVSVDGVRIHYLEKGAGPAVVLIHGNGVTAQDYELSGLLTRLSRGNRVIAFDRPGFGYTERPRRRSWTAADQADLMLGAMTALGVEEAVLIGHSWGTLVALEAARRRPERVRGLVLMSGYYWPTPRLDVPFFSGPAIPGLGDVMRFTISPLLGWLMAPLVFKQIFAPSKVPAHFKAGFATSMALRPSQLHAVAADTARLPLEAIKAAAGHRQVTAPVLVISGDRDRIVSFTGQSQRLAGELAAGQLQVVEGAGHMMHHTARDEVATGIETFLAQMGLEHSRAAAPAEYAQGG